MATREDILSRVKSKYPEYAEIPDDELATRISSKYPEYAEALQTSSSGFTTGLASPATDLAGIGFPVTDPTARARIAAERLVARERAAGFRPGDLLLREEAEALSKQAGIPTNFGEDVNVVSTSQFAPTPEGELLKSLVQARAATSAYGFQVPGAVGKIVEDLVLNEAQKKILGSQEMAARAPQEQSFGTIAGSAFPSSLIAGKVLAPEATLRQRALQGAQVGVPIGAISGAAGTVEQQGIPENIKGTPLYLQDLIQNTALGTSGGLVVGGGVGGVLGLPGAIKGTASRRLTSLDEKILKSQNDLQESIEAKSNLEDQIVRDVESASIKREKGAAQVALENQQRAFEDSLQQEQLRALEEAAQRESSQALTTSQQVQPQIELLTQASQEAPSLVGRITAGVPEAAQPSAFGRGITSSIESEYKAAKKLTDQDYNAIKEALPETQPKMEAPNLQEEALVLKQEQGEGFSSAVRRDVSSILGEATAVKKTGGLPPEVQNVFDNATPQRQAEILAAYPEASKTINPTYTWNNLQTRFQQINQKLHEAVMNEDGPTVRIYARLREALNKDMEAYATNAGSDVKSLFDDARANFVAREERFGTSRIQPLMSQQVKEKPNTLVQKIITGNNAPVVNNLKEILPPDQFQQVQAQYVDYLFSPSKGVSFDSSHFVKLFEDKKVKDETLEAVFGKEGMQTLKKLYEASKGAEAISGLQKTVDDVNSTAQKASDDFQKAKTKSQERDVQNSFKTEASKQLDELDAQLEIIKQQSNNAKTLQQLKSLQKDIDQARIQLDKAKNPAQMSIPSRVILGISALSAGYMSGHPYLGALAGAGSFATGERIGRNIITPIGMKLLNRAVNSKADSQASRELNSYLTGVSSRIETPALSSSIQESIDENRPIIPSSRSR